MSSLINLLISFVIALFFSQEIDLSKTVQNQIQQNDIELFQELQLKQQRLNS